MPTPSPCAFGRIYTHVGPVTIQHNSTSPSQSSTLPSPRHLPGDSDVQQLQSDHLCPAPLYHLPDLALRLIRRKEISCLIAVWRRVGGILAPDVRPGY